MFNVIRNRITRDFLAVKMWLENMSSITNKQDDLATIYGLFFVYIYGIYESIIKQIIGTTIDELNQSATSINSCIFELYSILLDSEYESLYQVGNEKKWEKRWDISRKLKTNQPIEISHDVFPTDRRNIQIRQLVSLKNSFGINQDVLPRPEIGHYIQEMVEHRNHIAHGDILPNEVGRNYTKNDLLQRCNSIAEICDYICDTYETYIVERKYIRQP